MCVFSGAAAGVRVALCTSFSKPVAEVRGSQTQSHGTRVIMLAFVGVRAPKTLFLNQDDVVQYMDR